MTRRRASRFSPQKGDSLAVLSRRQRADELVHLQFLSGESSDYVLFLKFFPKKIHCIYLGFGHALHINIHRDADVAVPQNCLNVLVRHSELMQVRGDTTPKCVPSVPLGNDPIGDLGSSVFYCENVVQRSRMVSRVIGNWLLQVGRDRLVRIDVEKSSSHAI